MKKIHASRGQETIWEMSAYILPLPGEGSPPQMDLMIYFQGGVPVIGKIQLQHWLKLIYREVYDCSDDDPRITKMLKVVTDPIRIS